MYTYGALIVRVKLEAGFMSLWYCGHLWSRYLDFRGRSFSFYKLNNFSRSFAKGSRAVRSYRSLQMVTLQLHTYIHILYQ